MRACGSFIERGRTKKAAPEPGTHPYSPTADTRAVRGLGCATGRCGQTNALLEVPRPEMQRERAPGDEAGRLGEEDAAPCVVKWSCEQQEIQG
jgi:hypothetical protein